MAGGDDHAEHRDQHQEKRENREKSVIRDQCGLRAGSIVAELLDDAKDKVNGKGPLLKRIDGPDAACQGILMGGRNVCSVGGDHASTPTHFASALCNAASMVEIRRMHPVIDTPAACG